MRETLLKSVLSELNFKVFYLKCFVYLSALSVLSEQVKTYICFTGCDSGYHSVV